MSVEGTGRSKTTTQRTFQYWAFVSYKRNDPGGDKRPDEKWAKWIQRKVENYPLPRGLRKQRPDLPKFLRPICRDVTEFGMGYVEDEIRKRLSQSHSLIVVCSPRAAKSRYVNREVRHFIELDREKWILPFIIDGKPDSRDPGQQCYPSALQQGILGASLEEEGKQRALVRIVAGMSGLGFDQLWQRHRRRGRLKKAAIAAVLVVMAVACGLWWDWARPKESYYEDYVTRWGIPEGIRPISDRDLARREQSWKFISQHGKLISVMCVNSAGQCVSPLDHDIQPYPHQELFYRPDGQLERVEISAASGRFLHKLKYDVPFRDSDGHQSVYVDHSDFQGGGPIFIGGGAGG
ncbi:MAG: toll/interleukin-1 receptor domain-containing protein, partial [Deltaproteobacteria bacterium]|nr:toll/interleukin-1 receptor domain-containing protein [Deltaproteobacteria bacterium]